MSVQAANLDLGLADYVISVTEPIMHGGLLPAAVFSGAAFGSNTCLYGDGVIMCAQGTQIKPLNLMLTTLPYACIAGGATVIAYLIVGFAL